jgi:Site-specific recombinase XerD
MTNLTDNIPQYLKQKRKLSEKSKNTYTFVLTMFLSRVNDKDIGDLTHEDLSDFIDFMEDQNCAKTTINLAMSACLGFFRWAAFERLWKGSIADIEYIATEKKPPIIMAAPDYDHEVIADLVEWSANYTQCKTVIEKRDAFMVLAASSSGARLGKELCGLTRGHVDWQHGRALVIGKGNKEGKLRFSDIALAAGRSYLQARAEMDGKSGQSLASLPLFARHHSNITKPLDYAGAYKSLKKRVFELFGEQKSQAFHPHLLRHEFVTDVLVRTGNLKLAQELARHVNIQTTQRYAHLSEEDLDREYRKIFNRTLV